MAHLLLAGYFGEGNLGDDSMLLGFVHGLGQTHHDITVMSGRPEETDRLYGLRAVARKDPKAFSRALDACDCVVFPGGSLFQDSTSTKSVAYYQQLVKRAKKAGKRVFLLGQGVGPLTGFLGKRMAADAFQAADYVTVRDPGSFETLKQIGVKRAVKVTADCAFLLPKPLDSPDVTEFKVGSMRAVGIAPRPYGKPKQNVKMFADLARMLYQANLMPVLIEMDRDEDGDTILGISKAFGGKIPDIRKVGTPMQLQQRIARMDSMIAMRLHAAILATTVGVAPLLLSYDPKVQALGRMLELPTLGMDGLTAQRIFDAFMEFQRHREQATRLLDRRVEEQKALAQQNVEIVNESLGVPAASG